MSFKRHAHIINHNKTIRNQKYYIFYDTETKEEEGGIKKIGGKRRQLKRLTLKLGWALFWKRGTDEKHPEKKEWFYFEKIQDFWNWIFKILEREKIKKIWIYAHNQDFDFKVMDGLSNLVAGGWECSFWTTNTASFILTFKNEDKTIHFIDTMNYSRSPLREIGKALEGFEKGNVDFETVSDEDLKTYCRRDVEILYEFVKQFLNFLENNNLGSLKQTIASTAHNVFRHRFLKDNINIHTYEKAIALERESYKGGRTECFRMGEIQEQVYALDVNSMYPYIMASQQFPTKLISYEEEERSGEEFIRFFKKAKKDNLLVIADLDFYLPVGSADIGIKEEIRDSGIDTLIFPVGSWRSSVCSPEIEYIIKRGEIIGCHQIALYEGSDIFKDFVEFFYSLRKKYKEEGNLIYSMLIKMLLNSLYGKIGQKNPVQEFINFEDNKKEISYEEIHDFVDGKYIHTEAYRVGKIGWYNTGEYEEGRDTFVAIPSFVTSYARVYLAEIMNVAGKRGEDYFYCDTDSLFVSEIGLQRCKDAGLLGEDLGKMHLEDEGDLEIFGCKDYIFNNETKIKGVKKDAVQKQEIGKENQYDQERFIRMKTAMKYGLVKDQYIYTETKILSRYYKKGIVDVEGDIRPYEN